MKKWLPLLCLLTAILLPGCTKSEVYDPKAHVYKATEIVLPTEDYAFDATTIPTWDGEKFLAKAYRVDHELGGTFVDNPRTYSFLPDGTGLTDITDTISAAADGMVMGYNDIGSGERLYQEVVNGEELYVTVKDEKDHTLFSREFASLFQVDFADIRQGDTELAQLGAVRAETDGEVRYLVLTSKGLCAFDRTGTLLWKLDTKENPTALLDTSYGILYLYGRQNEQVLCPVNPANGELGDPIELPPELTGAHTKFLTGAGYDLYASTNTALLGVNFVFDKDGNAVCQTETVIDWAMSELTPTELADFCIANPDTIAVRQSPAVDRFKETHLLLLTHIPPEEVVEKEIITLAMLDQCWIMPRLVTAFNKTSDTHRIVIKDYTIYETERRKTFFDAEMAAGSVPDMVFLADYWDQSLSESYTQAGLFADLVPLLEADETFPTEDLLGQVTKPYRDEAGAQYVFPLHPRYETMWADPALFDGPPTVAEVVEAAKSLSSPGLLMGRERELYFYLVEGLFNQLTDLEAGTCHFDDGTLAAILPWLNTLQSTDVETTEPLIHTLESRHSGLVSWVLEREKYGGSRIPIGWPGDGETLYADSQLGIFFGITATSQHKALCVDFLEVLLANAQETYTNAFYFREQVYDALAAYADKTILLTASGTYTVPDERLEDADYMAKYPGYSPDGSRRIKLTQADAEAFIAFLDDIDAVLPTSTELYWIYREEVFGSENRSPEEVAAAIQSRASIYLAERAK